MIYKHSLKPGAPFPRVRLPENYVERLHALNAVKEKLLAEEDRTLVVSAISGLGGLGKSVLATALVLDGEVQGRYSDGILWVTLGQNPDLQTMLGDWIQQLDKSREAFSANTLESASRYLHNLLAEKQVLLVVDDVWNAADADWFRVGGAGCRVLVTTREAQIEGAEDYPLDLMTEEEAVDLVRWKLDQQWQLQQEEDVKAFARLLGYLPLALDLAANQVKDGFTWEELQSEFEVERQAIALEVLDSSEAWERLDEEQQRKYSLRACFNLSLRRLKPEQLRQFVWLGVLPEDVNLSVQVAAVLWDVRTIKAKQGLIDLRWRSFLTDGVATLEGEPTYRVHDLMHDMARSLIEEGVLEIQDSGSRIPNLPLAHCQFLERYQERASDQRWDGLPNDGYIHRHLTWHMVQAQCPDAVHQLLQENTERGQNGWFEACESLGQPAIFVSDVGRGWALAEALGEAQFPEAPVLLWRYALIRASLNSLGSNIPPKLIGALVAKRVWQPVQGWTYVKLAKEPEKRAEGIQQLAPYLPETLLPEALEINSTLRLRNRASRRNSPLMRDCLRAPVLYALASRFPKLWPEVFKTTRQTQNDSFFVRVLGELVTHLPAEYWPEVLKTTRQIQGNSEVDPSDWTIWQG